MYPPISKPMTVDGWYDLLSKIVVDDGPYWTDNDDHSLWMTVDEGEIVIASYNFETNLMLQYEDLP